MSHYKAWKPNLCVCWLWPVAKAAPWKLEKGGRLGFSAEYSGEAIKGSFGRWDAKIVFDPEDLAGSSGTFQLRAEILRRVNLIAAPGKVDAVLIEEMLVQ